MTAVNKEAKRILRNTWWPEQPHAHDPKSRLKIILKKKKQKFENLKVFWYLDRSRDWQY